MSSFLNELLIGDLRDIKELRYQFLKTVKIELTPLLTKLNQVLAMLKRFEADGLFGMDELLMIIARFDTNIVTVELESVIGHSTIPINEEQALSLLSIVIDTKELFDVLVKQYIGVDVFSDRHFMIPEKVMGPINVTYAVYQDEIRHAAVAYNIYERS